MPLRPGPCDRAKIPQLRLRHRVRRPRRNAPRRPPRGSGFLPRRRSLWPRMMRLAPGACPAASGYCECARGGYPAAAPTGAQTKGDKPSRVSRASIRFHLDRAQHQFEALRPLIIQTSEANSLVLGPRIVGALVESQQRGVGLKTVGIECQSMLDSRPRGPDLILAHADAAEFRVAFGK